MIAAKKRQQGLLDQLDPWRRYWNIYQPCDRKNEIKATMVASMPKDEDGLSYVPQNSKLDFHWYNSELDLLKWLSRCEIFCRHQRTPEKDKERVPSFHLEGDGLPLFLKWERDWLELQLKEFMNQRHLSFFVEILHQLEMIQIRSWKDAETILKQ